LSKKHITTANVSWVNNSMLCQGCGACYVVCPYDAIRIVNEGGNNFPVINDDCTSCGLCNKVCSGQYTKADILGLKFFSIVKSGEGIYQAYSREKVIREVGSSGGFITQYLIGLLEEQLIDGVIVATSDGSLGSTKASIARTKETIISAAGSKYYPVSSCAALRDIQEGETYAFVGKGCDVNSLGLLQETIPRYRDVIYVKIGLFCHHTPYANVSEQLLSSYGFRPCESTIVYRGKGWPGQTILRDNNKEVKLDYKESWGRYLGKPENTSYRCTICTDSFAECADIAVGDAWALNPNLENRTGGFSLVLAYTQRGREEIERLKKSKSLEIEAVDKDFILVSQSNLVKKYEVAYYRLFALRLLNKISPLSHFSYIKSLRKFCSFIRARGLHLKRFLSSFKFSVCKGSG